MKHEASSALLFSRPRTALRSVRGHFLGVEMSNAQFGALTTQQRTGGVMSKDEPVKTVKLGRIEAAVWMNKSSDGREWFRVTLTRRYQIEDKWQSATNFDRDDLPVAAQALMMAHAWVWEQKAVWSGEGKSDGK
jgi:hypothetical protein